MLFKNRAALSGADAEDEGAISFAVFKKTVKMIKPESEFSEPALRTLFNTIDADSSGGITLKELVRHALDDSLHGAEDVALVQSEEVRAAAMSGPGAEEMRQKWWHGSAEDFSFLVRAYEPEFYCAHQLQSAFHN